MRSLTASLAALSIACGLLGSALANEPSEPMGTPQPLDAAQLDELRAGLLAGHGILRSYRDLGPVPIDSVASDLQRIVVLAATRAAKHASGDGLREQIPGGGMTQIDPPSLQLDVGPSVSGLLHDGLRSSFRETDFDFVNRAAMRRNLGQTGWSFVRVAERLRHRSR